jgi:tight adherence protein B
MRGWLRQAGLSIHPVGWVAVSLLGGLVAGYLGTAITGSRVLGGVLGIAAVGMPSWQVSRRRARRLGEAARAWPDGLRFLAASLRSGRTLPTALVDLPDEGPEALRPAFARFASRTEVFGTRVALEITRDEMADPLSDRVIEVLVTSLEKGGALVPALLHDMAESTTEDLRTAEEIDTNSLEQRLNARVVIVIPWVVLMVLTAQPGPFRDFYSSPAGTMVILLAGALSAVGFALLARFGRTATEPRLVEPRQSR